jgi:hypothetical protein
VALVGARVEGTVLVGALVGGTVLERKGIPVCGVVLVGTRVETMVRECTVCCGTVGAGVLKWTRVGFCDGGGIWGCVPVIALVESGTG